VAALRAFQRDRGLHDTGCCDDSTWKALVEATWKLGDRLLLLTSPHLRGDDVAELQALLGRLGFDCGRVDGIFGPATGRALLDFQANCGVPVDGACGAATVQVLRRVSGHSGTGPGVASVREHDLLVHRTRTLSSLNVVIGQFGGLNQVATAASRELRRLGAVVLALDEPDVVAQAEAANRFGADAYVGLDAGTSDRTLVHHYRVPAFESLGGRALAFSVSRGLRECGLDVGEPCGMRLPILRETRMPAVLCLLAPVRSAVNAAAAIGGALASAVQQWAERPSLSLT
jgi:N-acetylmuramoyl-L-alanine amidase